MAVNTLPIDALKNLNSEEKHRKLEISNIPYIRMKNILVTFCTSIHSLVRWPSGAWGSRHGRLRHTHRTAGSGPRYLYTT